MATIDPTTLRADELAPMLRAWAAGLYTSEAAVELLIAHGIWLRRRDFLTAAVAAVDDGWTRDGAAPMASIDFDAALALLDDEHTHASTSEAGILRLVASLADPAFPAWPLAACVPGLDATNAGLVLDAVAHLAGWHEYGRTRVVTGTFPDRPGR